MNSWEHYEGIGWWLNINDTQHGNQSSGLETENMQWQCLASPLCGTYVMPRVSLAITLTGMGNYDTESSDLEYQGSNQGAGFIDRSRYISVARFALLSLCLLLLISPVLARLSLLSCFPGMSCPCLWAPNLQCRPRTFRGLEFYDFVPGHGRIGPRDSGCVIAHKFGQLRLSPEN